MFLEAFRNIAESEGWFQVRPSVRFSVHIQKPGFYWTFLLKKMLSHAKGQMQQTLCLKTACIRASI